MSLVSIQTWCSLQKKLSRVYLVCCNTSLSSPALVFFPRRVLDNPFLISFGGVPFFSPPSSNPVDLDQNLDLEPVPPHTLSMSLDKLLAVDLSCRWVGHDETVIPHGFGLRACTASTFGGQSPARMSFGVKMVVEGLGAHGLSPSGFKGLTRGLEA